MAQIVLESPAQQRLAEQFCRGILPEVSRTFALSIRFLPGSLGKAVLSAYLLLRIADTIEDDSLTSAEGRVLLLSQFMECFQSSTTANAFPAMAQSVTGLEGHVRLVQSANLVFMLFGALPVRTQEIVHYWVGEMVRGMKKFISLYPQGIRIQTTAEYKDYCYYVAGTVGYLLTDLWHEHSVNVGKREYAALREKCQAFGEALQTVNILKDIAWDAEHENSIYIPQKSLLEHGSSQQTLLSPEYLERNQAAIASLIELAWSDLDRALEYLLLVPKQSIPIRMFCILPLLFAYATLRDINQSTAMLQPGGSVKISRAEVKSLILMGSTSIVSNRRVSRLVAHVRSNRWK